MRKLIAGMQSSVDGKIEGPEGYADWVETWSDNYDLMPQVDACLLGAKMFVGYQQYWSAIQNEPDKPLPMTSRLPTRAELEWARFAKETPHYVLSSTLTSALWPKTSFIRSVGKLRTSSDDPARTFISWGALNAREPDRCRAGGRVEAARSSSDRRCRQALFARRNGVASSSCEVSSN